MGGGVGFTKENFFFQVFLSVSFFFPFFLSFFLFFSFLFLFFLFYFGRCVMKVVGKVVL